MHSAAPIGIFDSGIGGTSIWREIHELVPNETCCYLADSKNAPYGGQSKSAILALSCKNTERLLAMGCKIIVVACNTATTNAISYLRDHYDVPFIGIEPAIKPAALQSQSKTVGVLATKGTLASDLFHNTAKNHASGITIIEQQGLGLVELIEKGEIASHQTRKLLAAYLQPMLAAKIDYLVLGCTHYPYLKPVLSELLPTEVQLIDSGAAVAKQTQNVLEQHQLLNTLVSDKPHHFYTNANVEVLHSFMKNEKGNITISYLDF